MSETATLAPPAYLTTLQAGRRYNVHRDTVWHWIKHGVSTAEGTVRLRAEKVGGRWKTTLAWLEEYIARCQGGEARPIAETPAAAQRRAAKDQQRAREVLRGKRKS